MQSLFLFCLIFLFSFTQAGIFSHKPYKLSTKKSDPWYQEMLTVESGSSSPCGDYSGNYKDLLLAEPDLVYVFIYEGDKNYENWFLTRSAWDSDMKNKADWDTGDDSVRKLNSSNIPHSGGNFNFKRINATDGTLFDFTSIPFSVSSNDGVSASHFSDGTGKWDDSVYGKYNSTELKDLFGSMAITDLKNTFPDPYDWEVFWDNGFAVPVLLSVKTDDYDYPYQCAYVMLAIVAGKYYCCGCKCCGD